MSLFSASSLRLEGSYRCEAIQRIKSFFIILVILLFFPCLFPLEIIQGEKEESLIFIVTDSYDVSYLDSFINNTGVVLNYRVTWLFNLNATGLDPTRDLIVLLDPNWKPNEIEEIKLISLSIASFVARGGKVIATYNGAVLLEYGFSKLDFPLRMIEEGFPDKLPLPSTYNSSKYGLMEIVGPHVRKNGLLYEASIGRGAVIFIPLNIVWAHQDTGDRVYHRILLEAIEDAELSSGGSVVNREALGIALALVASSIAAASQATGTRGSSLKGKKTLPAPILHWRVSKDEALRNEIRKKLFDIIEKKGFLHLNELVRLSGLGKAVVSWHLYILESRRLVSSLRWKNKRYYYIDDEQGLLVLLKGIAESDTDMCEAAEKLLEGIDYSRVASALRISARGLEDLAGLIDTVKGRRLITEACKKSTPSKGG